jgi:hypothetical protein
VESSAASAFMSDRRSRTLSSSGFVEAIIAISHMRYFEHLRQNSADARLGVIRAILQGVFN